MKRKKTCQNVYKDKKKKNKNIISRFILSPAKILKEKSWFVFLHRKQNIRAHQALSIVKIFDKAKVKKWMKKLRLRA